MKIITQLVILTLSLLLVNGNQHCNHLLSRYHELRRDCIASRITINSCCDLTAFPYSKAPSDVYKIKNVCLIYCEETAPFTTVTSDVYAICTMVVVDGL